MATKKQPKVMKPPPPGQMMDEKPMKTSRPMPVMTKLVKGGKKR